MHMAMIDHQQHKKPNSSFFNVIRDHTLFWYPDFSSLEHLA